MRAKIVAIMEWMQAQRADKRLRRQHAKVQQDERGGRGAPCVRYDEGANARAHVARWHVHRERCAANEEIFSCFRVDLSRSRVVLSPSISRTKFEMDCA